MRILGIKPAFHAIAFQNVTAKGVVVEETLPFFRATVDRLPPGLDALVATSDLQGRGHRGALDLPAPLLGELLAEELADMSRSGVLPPLDRVGVILAGDLYADPKLRKRGCAGDVAGVWRALARCAWVCGIAGNHDVFSGAPRDFERFRKEPRIHFLLDGETIDLGGLRFGGLSGVTGNPNRPYRHTAEDAELHLRQLLGQSLDILVLHEGAAIPERGWLGSPVVRGVLEQGPPVLAISGHSHAASPLHEFKNGTQALNVDARAVILEAEKPG